MAETTTKTASKKAVAKTTSATAKPATKKPAAEKKTVAAKKPPITAIPSGAIKSAVAKKPATRETGDKTIAITGEQRYRMVAEAAYYRAERNQFKSDPLRDWIEAENDIAALLSGKK